MSKLNEISILIRQAKDINDKLRKMTHTEYVKGYHNALRDQLYLCLYNAYQIAASIPNK